MSPIVVVDDERDIVDLVCNVLADEGYPALPFASSDSVVSVTQERHPALFVLDLMLPGTNGIELARLLRLDGAPDTPMIAMSASPSMLKAAADSQLFQETLPKPFDLGQLLETVERYLA